MLAAVLQGCQSAATRTNGGLQHRAAIEQVVDSFGRAIAEKNKALYMSLFFSDKPNEIGWQYVSEDTRLAQIRKSKPDAIKARRIPGNNFLSLIDESVGTNESREERFSNVQINTDGEIASVLFDYEFYAAGKKTQEVAKEHGVSRSWARRVKQRQRSWWSACPSIRW